MKASIIKISIRFIFVLYIVNSNFYADAAQTKQNIVSQIESGFIAIPDTIQTSVYWYWVSDNISEEGVVKDLHAMKRVGINRAFIGNIGDETTPRGNIKMFSEEWWKILHTALKTATELNIEIGIFNSPGWSQSGGPWVTSEQSMRYLNSSEIVVNGPQLLSKKIQSPDEDFQVVNVIAYQLPDNPVKPYRRNKPVILSSPQIANIESILDGDLKTGISISPNSNLTIDFSTKTKAVVRSLVINTLEKETKANAEFYVNEGGKHKLLASFEINRSNSKIHVGFDPYAPIVIAIPETKSKNFRLVLKVITLSGGIAEVDLSPYPYLERFPEKSLAKMFQSPLPSWGEYMWDIQPETTNKALYIDPESIKDITKLRNAEGILNWNVPAGKWRIIQTGMTPTGQTNGPATPEATGLETDKMSKKHIAAHFEAFLGEIMRRIPFPDRKTWKVAVLDSYETGGQNWTDGLTEEFESRYGYSPVPYLPVLNGYVVASRDRSDRFLWDLRRIIADKIAYDYVGGLREISHKNGLTIWLENYGHWGFPGEFLQYGGQSDEVAGEFWSEGGLGNVENKAASSCAHIYGKTKVSAESFTCAGRPFSRHPANMKQRGDRFFTEGINNTLLHVYIQQPDERVPGVNAWFGNEFNRHNTWFNYMDMFVQYIKRANFMLQQGKYVADVAYFIGEDVPKMTGICDPPLPQGYSFDYINAEVILTRLRVKNNKLVLPDGMTYSILVLPKIETMRPELLAKIHELVLEGAVVLGQKPKRSPSNQNYPIADTQVREIAHALWGKVDGVNLKHARVGKGHILSGMEMQEALDFIGVIPDCKLNQNDPVLFIHRTVDDGEIYFISNQSDKTIDIQPSFRVIGRSPELWCANNGTIRSLPVYEQTENTTIVPLKLEAYESQFIVFRQKAENNSKPSITENFPAGRFIACLNNDWTVTFEDSKRGPKKPVKFEKLSDWTTSANDSIKFYSGTAIYTKTISLTDINPDKRILLNLGGVTSMAIVKVNGKDVGGVWTAPWQVDITHAITNGDNYIEIAVVNNWMNRLIGDLRIPEDQRTTWSPVISYNKNSKLQPSGLFGPVNIFEFDN